MISFDEENQMFPKNHRIKRNYADEMKTQLPESKNESKIEQELLVSDKLEGNGSGSDIESIGTNVTARKGRNLQQLVDFDVPQVSLRDLGGGCLGSRRLCLPLLRGPPLGGSRGLQSSLYLLPGEGKTIKFFF